MESIAIVGIGCRFPGANNPEAFWKLLSSGVDAIAEVPSERWNIDTFYDPNPATPEKMYTRQGGFLGHIDQFDPSFFRISPREANYLDPQQRLLLEVAWEALENAAIVPENLADTHTGVFIGITNFDYHRFLFKHLSNLDAYSSTGTSPSITANRLSYLLDLRGPSMAVDTACSSSLVAVHLACQSLQNRESNLCLVGGVNLILSPESTIIFSQARMIAPDGRCKTFDASADGYVRAEGCGVIVLKRLTDALADGDRILAVIRGSAVNQDGLSNGITAPNGPAQQAVIRQALKNAQVQPAQISYVEAHGTGTSLGDPIEITSLKAVLSEGRSTDQPCWIGSVKTNIGHLEAAAGIAGLIKVVLSLQHQQIPPNLHLKKLNPYISLAGTAFAIPTEYQPWFSSTEPRLAGVSSFGFGGTNSHVILEQAPQKSSECMATGVCKQEIAEQPLHLLTLSAKNEAALKELGQRYADFLASHADVSLADICFTANTGRSHFNHRLAMVVDSREQLVEQLATFADGQDTTQLMCNQVGKKPPKIAFLFTGQGSQYINMGRQLYQTQPIFRKTLEQCDEILRPYLEHSLLEIMYPGTGDRGLGSQSRAEASSVERTGVTGDWVKQVSSLLDQTAYTQPALFAFEYALYQLWKSWGIEPNVVMGHSVGEYVAATVAGVFSLEDGLKLIVHRGQLMQQLPTGGEMVSLMASEAQVRQIIAPLHERVTIAAINGPESVVISGANEDISSIYHRLETLGIKAKRLQVSHAFHSPLMTPMLAKFAAVARQVTYKQPRILLVSNVTGQKVDEQIATAEYWVNHVIQPVRFADSMQTLRTLGYQVFLEIGPKPTLLGMGRQCLPDSEGLWLPSLRSGIPEWQQMLSSLGELYVQGAKIDWLGFERDYPRQKVALPTYPFQRQRYWIQQVEQTMNGKNLAVNSNKLNSKLDATLTPNRREEILATLQTLVGNLLQVSPADVNIHAPFLEMGADSIILVDAVRRIENTYKIKVAIRQLFEELTTIDTLATYIDQNLSPQSVELDSLQPNFKVQPQQLEQPTSTQSIPESSFHSTQDFAHRGTAAPETTLERIMTQQLQVMSQQLEVLHGNSLSAKSLSPSQNRQLPSAQPVTPTVYSPQKEQHNQITPSTEPEQTYRQPSSPLPPLPVRQIPEREIDLQQKRHIEVLSARYNQRHQKSKQLAQSYRPVLADSRATAGFRLSTKEILYPIAGEQAQGSRLWDVDGNEYVDLTMGFGVLLFGHEPQFVTEALEKHYQKGLKIGPQSKLAGEVAQLICELTGMERVTFCNSGTEAVMTALRLARSATGRTKIALFAGSYHGQFDGILATAAKGEIKAVPLASGVSQNFVENVLVLDYGNPKSIEILQVHAQELAAVLVEPVQSRRPDLQPKEFLQQLRQLTKASGTALIFDEVLTGFRIHPGGAQAWFGIEADIATYGKIIGGGTPIGVVAGKAIYMNGIDGGLWDYGDASYPQAEKIFFAGTFNKNHTGMVAALAVLQHLKKQGPELQQQLNQRTSQLAQTLNSYFQQENVPIRVVHFGSLFRFAFSGNLDLFFYHLIDKGVYIWEGRNCFLSTAYTDADIDYVIQAVKESVKELREGGFLPSGSSKLFPIEKTPNGTSSSLTEKKQPQEFWEQNGSVLQEQNNVSYVNSVVAEELKVEQVYALPLTEAQKQLWTLAQLGEDGSVAYHESVTLQLRGPLNATAMGKAIQKLVDRHEALRTKISPKGDVQEILPFFQIDCPVLDFSCVEGGLSQVAQWLDQESQKPFDLSNGSLLRVHLLKLEPELHLLALSGHHIVVDGWSMGVMLRELGAFYSAESQGTICQLNPPKQFREFIEWQNQHCQTQEMKIYQSYWLEKLTALPVLELPTDRIRPPIQTYNSSRETIKLDVQVTNKLKLFSREQGCTLLMTLLSVCMTLIHRLTGQDDIIVGVPTSGRSLLGSEAIVGYCSHFLPIRSQLTGNPTFVEYLKQMRGVLLEAYEHQDYPFAQLLNQLNLQRDISRSPLVDVSFNLEPSITLPQMSQLETSLFPQAVKFKDRDLHLNVTELAGELLVECDYNIGLFNADTIERWLSHFQTLLQAIVTESKQLLRELPLLTAEQRHQLLVEWNDTQADYPQDKCIHQLFEAQVEQTPNATAVVFGEQQLTYTQLNTQANQLAHYLQTLGVGPEVLVGICVERSLLMVIGLLGILKAGGAYVPLDPEYPQDRLSFMLEDAQVSVLLTQQRLLSKLPKYQANFVCLDTDAQQIFQLSQDNPTTGVQATNLAYVIYTSGSTGKPKGVAMNQLALCNLILWQLQNMTTCNDAKTLQYAPVSFDVSFQEIFFTWCSGGTLLLIGEELRRDTLALLGFIEEKAVERLFVPFVALQQLAEVAISSGLVTSHLREIITAGEQLRITPAIFQWLSKLTDCTLHNHYGPSESHVVTTFTLTNSIDTWPLLPPIGRPLVNTQIYILDKYLQPVPVGVPGELHIGGLGLARGYLNRLELTQEKFISNPFSTNPHSRLYKTGDLARYLNDSNIEYLGRVDNQVKIRGFRIELGEVEAILSQYPDVQASCVIAREDNPDDKCLIAYVVPHQHLTLTISKLRQFLLSKLPLYMIPNAFVILETLPLTPNGKIDRRALPSPNPELSRSISYVAPRNSTEKAIADIFTQVLRVERVGIYDNFFEIGGNSLKATQIISRLRETLSLEFPLRRLLEQPTVADLALGLEEIRSTMQKLQASVSDSLDNREEIEL
jgi:amino acid adenylation domain-containing protein